MNVKKHGLSSHTLYILHSNIKYKCHSKNIAICDKWKESFLNFYNDLIPTFEEGMSLYRYDLSKGFEPSNVYWRPSIKTKISPFKMVKAKIETTIKVIEALDTVDLLKDNRDSINSILADIIQQLKQ